MKKNLKKESERGERLKDVQTRTEYLSRSAEGFQRRANQLKKDMKWKENRTCLIASVGILVLLGLIALSSMYFAA